MIHLQSIHLVKSVSDQVLNYFFFVKRYHISLTMKVHQVHHLQKHMAYMYIILYEYQTFVNNSQWHTKLLYMTFEWLVPIKRAEVYVSWRNTLPDLAVSPSDLATSSQDNIQEIFRQVSFPWHCYIAHTHTRLYKAVYYRKKSILTIEYLNYKSFSNLCGVADWLIISDLSAILPCVSSFIK